MESECLQLESVNNTNYLGSPEVVGKIVQVFVDKIHETMLKKLHGEAFDGEMTSNLEQMSKSFSDIFLGKNPDYLPIRGWNCMDGLGFSVKMQLGENWTKRKPEYDDDPLQVLFGWLCVNMLHEIKNSQTDPELAAAAINSKKMMIVKTLLDISERG